MIAICLESSIYDAEAKAPLRGIGIWTTGTVERGHERWWSGRKMGDRWKMERKKRKKRTARVAVIGLAGQSAFMTAEHFPVPGETIACEALFFELGGKGYNQAIACARMGAETVFIGAVGADINGRECRCELEREGIIPCLVEKEEPTAYAVITTRTDSENTVAVCSGAAKALCGEDLRAESVFREIEKSDYILLQNELSQECLESAFALAQELGIPVIFNPAPAHHIPPELLVKSAVVTPNYGEAKELMGYRPEDEPSEKELSDLFRKKGIKQSVVTMGSKGALLIDENRSVRIPAFSCGKASDTTGAGDTFNGTLAASLALGNSLEEAVCQATVAAGISVTRRGAAGSIPTTGEVKNWLKRLNDMK